MAPIALGLVQSFFLVQAYRCKKYIVHKSPSDAR
jgi:hypothetical protein